MTVQSSHQAKGFIFLLIAAVLYSTMPVLIRFLGSTGLPPMTQVFFRYVVAFFAAAIYFPLTSKKKVTIERKSLLVFLVATLYGYALTNLFYTYAILNTFVGNALFLFFSFAIIAPILGFFLLKDRVNTFNIIALVLTFFALLFLFQPNTISTWKIGGLFALIAALGQALYFVLRKKLHMYPANFMMLANTAMGVVSVGLLSIFTENTFYVGGGLARLPTQGWIITVLFGLINFFAWLTMTKGFEYVKAATGSIVLLLELLIGVIFAFLFFREIPTPFTILGGLLIVIASIIVIRKGAN